MTGFLKIRRYEDGYFLPVNASTYENKIEHDDINLWSIKKPRVSGLASGRVKKSTGNPVGCFS